MQDNETPKRKSSNTKRKPREKPKIEVVILNPQPCLPDAVIKLLVEMAYEVMRAEQRPQSPNEEARRSDDTDPLSEV